MFAEEQAYLHVLAADLGVTLSPSKRQGISQRAEYTGVIMDTIIGRYYILDKKLEKLRASLRELYQFHAFRLGVRTRLCTTRYALCTLGHLSHCSLCHESWARTT
jgi:hypothetical protein